MRNVAGEIKGAEFVMRYCVENGIDKVRIYYDYEGIAAWAEGRWKTNKEGTIHYKRIFDELSEKLTVEFVKVKSHSGDKYNDMADRLAKDAAGVE
jgi:ribonuclease HI